MPMPVATIKAPRIYVGSKILAGTLAGAIDPVAFFGLHGGLISGKIAAIAVEDKERGWREFKKCVSLFPTAYTLNLLKEMQPLPLSVLGFRLAFMNFDRLKLVQRIMVEGIPGTKCLTL